MLRYVFKRLLMMIPVIIGISFLLFAVMNLTPGDPARLILGEYALQSDVDQLREEMGLNDNFFVRYGNYLKNAARGDFGESYMSGLPVSEVVISRFPTTLKLATGAMLIAVLIGIPVGIISAVKQYTIIDALSLFSSLLLTSMPGFWLGLMLILLFALKLDLLPAIGSDSWINFIMPSITLAAATLAILIRMTRSTMLEVIRQDYIRTAKAKGAEEKRIIFKHALRNALLPIITVIGINFGIQLGGSVIIENVFAIPGIGSLMIDSVKMKDAPIVLASVMLVALLGGLVNLAVDIMYIYIDPRIKSQYVKG
ncbi:MAG: ABC transporter permease [Clostridiaceae bacterium]|nr:ABC transporter permease [Clostridiaceae bacterium]